tara:strand:+ start:639 stop:839 length:201 start_codon:yes stop_codon:yes gene_type:complete
MGKSMEHVLHAAVLTFVLYLGMVYLLKQNKEMACSRSILLGSLSLVYMVLFGHSVPPSGLNPSLGF